MAESRRQPAPSAGGLASPLLLQHRWPGRRLLADGRLWRRRCHHRQRRLFQTLQDNTSHMIAHRRQQPSKQRRSSPDHHQQQLLLQSAYRRSQGRSLHQRQPTRRTVSATTASTSHILYMRSMTSRKFTTSA